MIWSHAWLEQDAATVIARLYHLQAVAGDPEYEPERRYLIAWGEAILESELWLTDAGVQALRSSLEMADAEP
jgi:hypothetical protein